MAKSLSPFIVEVSDRKSRSRQFSVSRGLCNKDGLREASGQKKEEKT